MSNSIDTTLKSSPKIKKWQCCQCCVLRLHAHLYNSPDRYNEEDEYPSTPGFCSPTVSTAARKKALESTTKAKARAASKLTPIETK